mmetsp:Transcript_58665/g.166776  ORF Transcript_58665/g.166776 Transcript_58665/m.166776 type:complete len:259 (+) Transcript_58665:120-896(+)
MRPDYKSKRPCTGPCHFPTSARLCTSARRIAALLPAQGCADGPRRHRGSERPQGHTTQGAAAARRLGAAGARASGPQHLQPGHHRKWLRTELGAAAPGDGPVPLWCRGVRPRVELCRQLPAGVPQERHRCILLRALQLRRPLLHTVGPDGQDGCLGGGGASTAAPAAAVLAGRRLRHADQKLLPLLRRALPKAGRGLRPGLGCQYGGRRRCRGSARRCHVLPGGGIPVPRGVLPVLLQGRAGAPDRIRGPRRADAVRS